MESWSDRLRRLRAATRLSQVAVGKHLGIAGPSVAQWEIGRSKPSLDRLPALAALYGVSLDELCGSDLGAPEAARAAAEVERRHLLPKMSRRFAAGRWAYWDDELDTAAHDLKVEQLTIERVETGVDEPTQGLLLRFHMISGIPMSWFLEGRLDGVPSLLAGRIGFRDPDLVPDYGPGQKVEGRQERRQGGTSTA